MRRWREEIDGAAAGEEEVTARSTPPNAALPAHHRFASFISSPAGNLALCSLAVAFEQITSFLSIRSGEGSRNLNKGRKANHRCNRSAEEGTLCSPFFLSLSRELYLVASSLRQRKLLAKERNLSLKKSREQNKYMPWMGVVAMLSSGTCCGAPLQLYPTLWAGRCGGGKRGLKLTTFSLSGQTGIGCT